MVEMNRPPDNREAYILATELVYENMLSFRTGYNLSADELRWSGGVGLFLRQGEFAQRIDYAFTDSNYLGRVDRLSAGVQF
jgi:hypothetical protein